MHGKRPIVCSIAGFDPCGGAGVLADIKTFEQLQVQGMAVITGYTIQTEEQCYRVDWRPLEAILAELDVLLQRYDVAAIKIGIVPNAGFLQAVVRRIKQQQHHTQILWDPVLRSSSGLVFFNEETLPRLARALPAIDLITPNFPEYGRLVQHLDLQDTVVLVKGGHRSDLKGVDILCYGHVEVRIEPETDGPVAGKHGSGCVLSSAIASHLALGETMGDACKKGKQYIENYLKSSPTLMGIHHER